jgi:hypothetical protein
VIWFRCLELSVPATGKLDVTRSEISYTQLEAWTHQILAEHDIPLARSLIRELLARVSIIEQIEVAVIAIATLLNLVWYRTTNGCQ